MCCVGLTKKITTKKTTTTVDAAVRNIQGQLVFRHQDVSIGSLAPHSKIKQFFTATVVRRS